MENFFHLINNIYQKIKFTIEGESNRELEFLETLLKANNGKISVLDIESLHIQFNTYTTTLTTKQAIRKVLFPPCSIQNISLSPIKMT